MFNDVDESLRSLLIADMPIERNEIDISFDRPTREWSGRLSKPTLNLFLMDMREHPMLRNDVPEITRLADGTARRAVPSRRIDMSYLVTAWAREAADEHRILSRVLATMFRLDRIPEEHLAGQLVNTTKNVLARIMPPDHLTKPADFWGVMDNELHSNLMWVITAPLDAFEPITGPIVRTAEFRFSRPDADWMENSFTRWGHRVYRRRPHRGDKRGHDRSARDDAARHDGCRGTFRFRGRAGGRADLASDPGRGPSAGAGHAGSV